MKAILMGFFCVAVSVYAFANHNFEFGAAYSAAGIVIFALMKGKEAA